MVVTGWEELLTGNIWLTIMTLYEAYYGDWFITILFLSYKLMVWLTTHNGSTGNILLGFTTSIIFLGVFYSTLDPTIVGTIVAVAVLELGAILYSVVFKK